MIEVGAAEQLLHEDFLAGHVGLEILPQSVELLRRHGGIVVPPDLVLGLGIADGELVLGGAAGMGAGLDHERAALGDFTFTAPDGFLVETRFVPVEIHGTRANTQRFQPAVAGLRHGHVFSSPSETGRHEDRGGHLFPQCGRPADRPRRCLVGIG